jgi:hypothetical protein
MGSWRALRIVAVSINERLVVDLFLGRVQYGGKNCAITE